MTPAPEMLTCVPVLSWSGKIGVSFFAASCSPRTFEVSQTDIVVVIGERHRALARRHALKQRRVGALRRPREIGDHAAHPLLRLLRTPMRDQRAQQREIVDRRARAHADLALEPRVGERLVGLHELGIDARRIDENHPRPGREAEPQILRVLERGGNAFVQHLRLHGLEQILLLREPEIAGIDGEEDIGRRVLAFGPHAREQLGPFSFDHIYGNSSRFLEAVIEQVIRLIVTRGVDIDRVGRDRGACLGQHNAIIAQVAERVGRMKILPMCE